MRSISCVVGLVAAALACGSASALQFERMKGLMAAAFTPFNATDGYSVNYNAVAQQASWLASTGVKHVLVAGTTGESVKLTTHERQLLAEEWVKYGP